MSKLLESAKKSRAGVVKRIDKFKSKLIPLEKELRAIDSVINLLDPKADIDNVNKFDKSVVVSPEISVEDIIKDHTVADKIRGLLISKPEGLSTDKLREFAKLSWPKSYSVFERGMHNALIFLANNGEIEKFGQGAMANYKPTPKCVNPYNK